MHIHVCVWFIWYFVSSLVAARALAPARRNQALNERSNLSGLYLINVHAAGERARTREFAFQGESNEVIHFYWAPLHAIDSYILKAPLSSYEIFISAQKVWEVFDLDASRHWDDREDIYLTRRSMDINCNLEHWY